MTSTATFEMFDFDDGSGFSFSAPSLGDLTSAAYTVVQVVIDTTGSTQGFTDKSLWALKETIKGMQNSPAKARLMLRVTEFNSHIGIREITPFTPVLDIDVDAYAPLSAQGVTPLYDATYEGFGAVRQYCEELYDNDFDSNGLLVVVTDGLEGPGKQSNKSPDDIANAIAAAKKTEKIDSVKTILVGIDAAHCKDELDAFASGVGFDEFVSADDADEKTMRKLAGFIVSSAVSQSGAMGTGAPSGASAW